MHTTAPPIVGLKAAARHAGVTPQAVLRWLRRTPGLGHKDDMGRWLISRAGLEAIMAARAVLRLRQPVSAPARAA